jgi:probable F420-dependent oxidoreductase
MSVGLLQTRFPVPAGDPWLLAREAERLGFESLWAGEHMVVPKSTHATSPYHQHGVPSTPSPLMRLAGAAAVTRTIKLGTSVLLLPQHHPVLLAKELATLDADSGGRLLVGVGIGWNPEEAAILGADWAHRVRMFQEEIEVMRALWTGDFIDYHGKHFDYPLMASRPGPYQQPGPPILLGMNHPKGVDRAVAYADGWLPGISRGELIRGGGVDIIARGRSRIEELCHATGRDPTSITISVVLADDTGGEIDRPLIDEYLRAGANRVILLGTFPEGMTFDSDRDAVRRLESIARRTIA